ncbi:MAG: protein translocase subunit SecF, partial [Mycobacteriales bacterium]
MGLIHRLYHGETTFPLIMRRKRFYAVSVVLVVVALASMLFRGFNLGVEFKGGGIFQLPVPADVDLKASRSFVEGLG